MKNYAALVFFISLTKAIPTASKKTPNAIPKYNMAFSFN